MASGERNLHGDLLEQLAFLDASCAGYDAGMRIESKRLAVTIRVLVHDTSASRSLLKQMDVKHRLQWLFSGGGVDPHNLLSTSSLCFTRMTTGPGQVGVEYLPLEPEMMLAAGRLVDFDVWWETPVIKDIHGETFTRRDLVLALANKDGGAHIERLQARIRALAHEGSLGWSFGAGPDPAAAEAELITITPLLASVRTIADEVRLTLNNQREVIGLAA